MKLFQRRDQWQQYKKDPYIPEEPYVEIPKSLDDLAKELKEQQSVLRNAPDPRDRMNAHAKVRALERQYFQLRGKIALEKVQKREKEKAEAQKLKAPAPSEVVGTFTVDLSNAMKEHLKTMDGLEQALAGSDNGWNDDLPMPPNSQPIGTLTNDDLKARWIPSSHFTSGTTTVNSTINTGDLSGLYNYEYRPGGRSRESSILNKHTENMAKGKLPKIIYELVMHFEMNPTKGGLAAVLEQLQYPTPWPSFDSIKGISINNDKIIIETYDSESEVDRDLFDSANGFGHGIQPLRHKKSESPIDKLLKPKGAEVGVQPRRVFKSGRTLRLSD